MWSWRRTPTRGELILFYRYNDMVVKKCIGDELIHRLRHKIVDSLLPLPSLTQLDRLWTSSLRRTRDTARHIDHDQDAEGWVSMRPKQVRLRTAFVCARAAATCACRPDVCPRVRGHRYSRANGLSLPTLVSDRTHPLFILILIVFSGAHSMRFTPGSLTA